jgi:hypothetical protein
MPELFKTKKGQPPQRLASTVGHVVVVGANWQVVPDCLVSEALKKGLLSKDLYNQAMEEVRKEALADITSGQTTTENNPGTEPSAAGEGENKENKPTDKEPDSQEDHKLAITKAVLKVLELSESTDKTPGGKPLLSVNNGKPKVDAVSEIAGFKVSAAEIDEALQ